MNAVIVDQITKRFEDHVAVDGISFSVEKGSIYGLLGPNGAGKTTTIRMMLNILSPDTGSVRMLDLEPGTGVLDRIGYLPEERGLYTKMKVIDQLIFLGEIKGVPRKTSAPRVERWLQKLGLADWKDKKVEELSKGMQQKVQFIGTVLHEPEVLVLDEPFSGLDPINTNLLKDVVLELNRRGTTIIFSTHIMEQVERMCESICLINKGKILVEGKLTEAKQRYGTNNVVLAFEGDGAFLKNLPAVERLDLHGNYAEMRLHDGSDPRTILDAAMGQVRINRFEVVEPTLNSIFIDLVGQPVEAVEATEPPLAVVAEGAHA